MTMQNLGQDPSACRIRLHYCNCKKTGSLFNGIVSLCLCLFFFCSSLYLRSKPENEGWILFVLLSISVSHPIGTTNSKGFLDQVKDDTGRRTSC